MMSYCSTSFVKIKRIRGPLAGWLQLQQGLEELKIFTGIAGAEGIREKIKEMVPEYSYQSVQVMMPHKIQVRMRVQEGLRLDSVPVDGD